MSSGQPPAGHPPLSPEDCHVHDVIRKFVSTSKASIEQFHIQGWRWHTMSLVREAERLARMARRFQSYEVAAWNPIASAVDYVIGFNLKGLHKIEADLFFPWMREKLMAIQEKDLALAFGIVMDELENDRQRVAQLGESIVSKSCVCKGKGLQEGFSNSETSLLSETLRSRCL